MYIHTYLIVQLAPDLSRRSFLVKRTDIPACVKLTGIDRAQSSDGVLTTAAIGSLCIYNCCHRLLGQVTFHHLQLTFSIKTA